MVNKTEEARLYGFLRQALESEVGIELELLDPAALHSFQNNLWTVIKRFKPEFDSLSIVAGPGPPKFWIIRRTRIYEDPFAD